MIVEIMGVVYGIISLVAFVTGLLLVLLLVSARENALLLALLIAAAFGIAVAARAQKARLRKRS
jgi:prolipoprotein diacylglyceryltransferase